MKGCGPTSDALAVGTTLAKPVFTMIRRLKMPSLLLSVFSLIALFQSGTSSATTPQISDYFEGSFYYIPYAVDPSAMRIRRIHNYLVKLGMEKKSSKEVAEKLESVSRCFGVDSYVMTALMVTEPGSKSTPSLADSGTHEFFKKIIEQCVRTKVQPDGALPGMIDSAILLRSLLMEVSLQRPNSKDPDDQKTEAIYKEAVRRYGEGAADIDTYVRTVLDLHLFELLRTFP